MQPFRPDLCTLEWHGGTRMVLCVFCRNLVVCLLILRIGTRPMVGKKCARTQKWSWMDLVQTDFQRLTNASGKPEMRLEIKFSSETWHLLTSFGYRCSSCKDAKIPCLARHGFAGNAESQCSIICRALSPGAVCWRNHWGVSWEFDESQCHVNVFSCFSMFFYHSSQLRYELELEFATGIWHLRSVTAKTGQLCLAPCGCPRRPKPNVRSHPWMVRLMEPIRARPKMEKKATIFGKKTHSPHLIESLKPFEQNLDWSIFTRYWATNTLKPRCCLQKSNK